MRIGRLSLSVAFVTVCLTRAPVASAGSLTYSHSSSALPAAPGPGLTLLSITGVNDGTNLTFTLTFANPTIEGPSSGIADAVYGFINLDTDRDSATGKSSGMFLDSNGLEPGFGRFTPGSQGVDAYLNLSSEGDPLHGVPGLVDLVSANGFIPIDTITVTYSNQAGLSPSTLSLSIPLSDFSANQIDLRDTGDFSVVVGNLNNATDFLPASGVPEPSSLFLLTLGLTLGGLVSCRLGGDRTSKRRTQNDGDSCLS